jgi:sulfatase maturation enzyme AslB (radical SAM superfamily)
MDLIIKPTELCNFKCTFCSSTDIAEDSTSILELDVIYDFLDKNPDTNTIIVNGGDPLMMPPAYYWSILDYIKDTKTTVSFTTNLWPFYVKPEKWLDIFKHPQVGVNTSFQYGTGRLKGDYTVFTEEDFWGVSDSMLKYVGYRPDFIAVVVEGEESLAIKNVELAKKMDVECKLNYAMASGDQDKPLLLASIYRIYLEIYDRGLGKWEYNTKDIIKSINNEGTACPKNRTCEEGIRCLQPEQPQYTCGAFADDKEYPIGESFREDLNLLSMTDSCFTCPLFNLCNGCAKTIKDHKRFNMQHTHCFEMKQIEKQLLEMNE